MFDYRNHVDEHLEGDNLTVRYQFTEEQLEKMPNFGDSVLIIKNGNEYIKVDVKEWIENDELLLEFTGNRELVLQANNPTALVKMIKWASTTASMVSAPSSKPMNVDAASTPAGVAPVDDPFAPANNAAPLVLDMSNIPNPDDFDEGAVW